MFKLRYFLKKYALLITIVISLITPTFLIWQHFDTKATEGVQNKSKITMRIGALRNNIIFNKVNGIDYSIVYRQKYKCVLSNEGSIDEGIIHWDIYHLDEQAYGGEKKLGYAWYAGMNPRLIDKNNQDISLPLNISARENKVVYIEVGMIVPTTVWKIVSDKIELNKLIEWYDAYEIFSKVGYPLFGQVSPTEDNQSGSIAVYEAGSSRDYEARDSYQSFWIRFIKTNDYQITGEFSINVNDLYKQGEI